MSNADSSISPAVLPQDALDPAGFRRRLASWPYLSVVGAFVLLGFLATQYDIPLARYTHDPGWPKAIAKMVELSEVFAHGAGVAVILLVVFVLDPARRWVVPRLICMSLGAGLASNIIKLLLARSRPRSIKLNETVWETFGQWLPLGQGGSAWQSFPSSHTATAVGLAVALSALYPRGRWLFFILAAAAGCQRIESEAHFLSDTFWGAAVGWLVAVGLGRFDFSKIRLHYWEERAYRRSLAARKS